MPANEAQRVSRAHAVGGVLHCVGGRRLGFSEWIFRSSHEAGRPADFTGHLSSGLRPGREKCKNHVFSRVIIMQISTAVSKDFSPSLSNGWDPNGRHPFPWDWTSTKVVAIFRKLHRDETLRDQGSIVTASKTFPHRCQMDGIRMADTPSLGTGLPQKWSPSSENSIATKR